MGQEAFEESKEAVLKNFNRVIKEGFTWLLKTNHDIRQAWQAIHNLREEYPEKCFRVNIFPPRAEVVLGDNPNLDSSAYELMADSGSMKKQQKVFNIDGEDEKFLRSCKISPE